MICWRCLLKMVECGSDGDYAIACPVCGDTPLSEGSLSARFSEGFLAARSNRLMALVAALSSRDGYDPGEPVVHDALRTMREIERRVEAGELWEVQP